MCKSHHSMALVLYVFNFLTLLCCLNKLCLKYVPASGVVRTMKRAGLDAFCVDERLAAVVCCCTAKACTIGAILLCANLDSSSVCPLTWFAAIIRRMPSIQEYFLLIIVVILQETNMHVPPSSVAFKKNKNFFINLFDIKIILQNFGCKNR